MQPNPSEFPPGTDDLIAEIRRAFHGVTLGKGIGLWEADALDDYADEDEQSAAKARNEMCDWSAIPAESLVRCHAGLFFFDADGMRFHLPAFLIAEIRGELDLSPIFCLTRLDDDTRNQLSSLNRDQRRCLLRFMQWCLIQDRYTSDRRDIEEMLRDQSKYSAESGA